VASPQRQRGVIVRDPREGDVPPRVSRVRGVTVVLGILEEPPEAEQDEDTGECADRYTQRQREGEEHKGDHPNEPQRDANSQTGAQEALPPRESREGAEGAIGHGPSLVGTRGAATRDCCAAAFGDIGVVRVRATVERRCGLGDRCRRVYRLLRKSLKSKLSGRSQGRRPALVSLGRL
jgi:hypothetical protein